MKRTVQITQINFKTGEVGFQFSDVELTYLTYISPPSLSLQSDEVLEAVRRAAVDISPIENDILIIAPEPLAVAGQEFEVEVKSFSQEVVQTTDIEEI